MKLMIISSVVSAMIVMNNLLLGACISLLNMTSIWGVLLLLVLMVFLLIIGMRIRVFILRLMILLGLMFLVYKYIIIILDEKVMIVNRGMMGDDDRFMDIDREIEFINKNVFSDKLLFLMINIDILKVLIIIIVFIFFLFC